MSGFWQDGAVLEALTDWMHRVNITRQLSILRTSWRSLDDLLLGYQPYPSFDDLAWYGMAFARIYETVGHMMPREERERFGSTAVDIFNWIAANGWDNDTSAPTWCGGGFWWDNKSSSTSAVQSQ